MVKEFVERYMARKDELRATLAQKHPNDYHDLICAVVSILRSDDDFDTPDATRVHQINDGDYQGTLVFVIGAEGYQPSEYWYVKVGYGSCSGCDTLEAIRCGYYDEAPTAEQIDQYMTLALHIVQGLKLMGGESV